MAKTDQIRARNMRSEAENGTGSNRASPLRHLPLILAVGGLLAISLIGVNYYLAPMAVRVRDPLHAWFKPSGYIGQTAGILSFVLFLFMWLYPLRKRLRILSQAGSLKRWLEIHIFAGLVLPLIGAVHAGWRFHGLIGLGFLAMVLVSLSGIVGRYLYIRIPRTRAGAELSLEQIESRRKQMLMRIASATGLPEADVESILKTTPRAPGGRGPGHAMIALLTSDLLRWRTVRALKVRLGELQTHQEKIDGTVIREVARMARREIALAQQVRLLEATQRVFRFWHVAHLPFAISAFVAVAIHVVVVVSLGVTWVW